jgi:hypothetical protein
MGKFEIGTKVRVKATGDQGEILALDGYGTVEEMLRLNPKPYIVQIGNDIPRFDEEELEILSS